MIYLTGCVPKQSHQFLDDQVIGFLTTPNIGNHRKPEWIWAADSGCFNRKTYKGDEAYITWLTRQHSKEKCLFATAPDVLGDAAGTLKLAQEWLPTIKDLGYSPALVTQDGMTPEMVPWNQVDWLFLGGTDSHKLGPEGKALIAAAIENGKRVHVGRVNSQRRYLAFKFLGADSADGTFLAFAPSTNLKKLISWIRHGETQGQLEFIG